MIKAYQGHRPEIHESCFVAENAAVIGQVKIGEKSSVWFGAVIRCELERIEIGESTNIQDCCIIHTDLGYPTIIGNNVTVGHGAIVHGATVGDNTLVGMGAILMNGVKVGKNAVIGAGALCTENMVIPEGSVVVGSPAKVVKTAKEYNLVYTSLNSIAYTELAAEYKKEGNQG